MPFTNTMDFEEICYVFRGGLFNEDYTLHFTSVKHHKEEWEPEGTSDDAGANNEKILANLLLQAIYHSLTSNHTKALLCLETLLKQADGSVRWSFRAQIYRLYVYTMKIHPPPFRFAPLTADFLSPWAKVKKEAESDFLILDKAVGGLLAGRDQKDVLELMIIGHFWHTCQFRRSKLSFMGSQAPSGPNQTALSDGLRCLLQQLSSLVQWIPAEAKWSRITYGNLTREIVKAADSLGFHNDILLKFTTDTASQDRVAQEDIAKPSAITRPTALNVILSPGFKMDLETEWDNGEKESFTQSPKDTQRNHEPSLQQFRDANDSSRELAGLFLSSSCERLLEGAAHPRDNTLMLHQIQECFDAAFTFFEANEDGYSTHLVAVHKLILRILLMERGNYRNETSVIGAWAVKSGNQPFGLLLGLLASRFGRRMWLRYRFLDTAVRSCEIGLGIFKSMANDFACAQTHATIASIYSAVNAFQEARYHYEEAYRHLIPDMDHKSLAPDVINTMIDKILENCFNLQDEGALKDFITDIKPKYDHAFPSGNFSIHETFCHTWQCKIKLRSLLRQDKFGEAQTEMSRIFEAKVPTHLLALYVKWGYMNIAFNYGRMGFARKLLAEIGDEYFSDWKKTPGTTLAYFDVCINCYDFDRAEQFFAHAMVNSPNYFNTDLGQRSDQDFSRLVHAALFHQARGNWEQSMRSLSVCCHLAETQRLSLDNLEIKTSSFGHSDVAKAFSWMVRACLHHAADPSAAPPTALDCQPRMECESWNEQALIFAERAKARALLDLREQSLQKLEAESVAQLKRQPDDSKDIADTEHGIENFTLNDPSMPPQQNHEDEISKPEFAGETPPQPPTLNKRFSTLDPSTLIISTTLCHEGLALFLITNSGIKHASWNSNFTIWTAQELISAYQQPLRTQGTKANTKDLDAITAQLSAVLVKPLAEHLRKDGIKEIVFIPANYLIRTPFSALHLDGKPLYLSVAVSQAPSLNTFLALQASLAKRPPCRPSAICTITRPTREARYRTPGDHDILFAPLEAICISHFFNYTKHPWKSDSTSPAAFRSALQDADILHVATHGLNNIENILQSAINIREPFTLHDFANCTTNASLVFFSACWSGIGFSSLTDDVTGFSSQILGTGAAAFIGALWAVDDLCAFFLVYFFYKGLAEAQKRGDRSIRLTHLFGKAQRELAGLEKAHAEAILDEVGRIWAQARERFDTEGLLWNGEMFLKLARRNNIPEGFGHPDSWAGFVFVGCGARVFE